MKRSIPIRSVLILAVLGLALGGCDWIKSLGKKDNVEPPTPLTEFTPTVQVQRLWTEGAGNGAGDSGARLAPTVVDGRLYAASVDGTIEAIDAASGRTLWQKHLGDRHGWLWKRGDNTLRWSGGPAVLGDLLVVGGLDGNVYALSSQDGSERWHVTVSSEVITRPAISEQIVVVRTIDGRLTGLDTKDGSTQVGFRSVRAAAQPARQFGAGDRQRRGLRRLRQRQDRRGPTRRRQSAVAADAVDRRRAHRSRAPVRCRWRRRCRSAAISSRSAIADRSPRSPPTPAVRSGNATFQATVASLPATMRWCSPTPTATSGRSIARPARVCGSRISSSTAGSARRRSRANTSSSATAKVSCTGSASTKASSLRASV